MACNICGGKIKTTDSRSAETAGRSLIPDNLKDVSFLIWRRKRCLSCGDKMTTFELSYDELVRLNEFSSAKAKSVIEDLIREW